MIGITDAILSIGGLLVPPVFDFIKKKFLPESDTPSATLSTLATTKPEVIAQYVQAQADLLKAQTLYFNRDVVGEVSKWVSNLRASIRPIYVILGLAYFFVAGYFHWEVHPCIKYTMEIAVNSWFGSRLLK